MPSTLTRALAAGAAPLLLLAALSLAQMPPGHPDVGPGRKSPDRPTAPEPERTPKTVAPRAEDVTSPDALIRAYYQSISGAKGEPRDWDRFRSLFLPDADLMSVQQMHQSFNIISLKPDEYANLNDVYFTKGGYFESEIHRETRSYGIVSQAFSTYESRRHKDAEAYSRGINAFQLLFDGTRWWISSVTWDRETPEDPIPAEFLPEE